MSATTKKTEDQLLAEYHTARIALESHRDEKFPDRSAVIVDCGAINIRGMVIRDLQCDPSEVGVQLERRRNAHSFPIESVKPLE